MFLNSDLSDCCCLHIQWRKKLFSTAKKKTDTFSHGQTDRNSLEWKYGKTISKLITHGLQNIKPIESSFCLRNVHKL